MAVKKDASRISVRKRQRSQRSNRRRPWWYPSTFKAGVLTTFFCLIAFRWICINPEEGGTAEALSRFVTSLNHYGYDLMFRVRGRRPSSGEVVIVDIDEKSLKDPVLGQWPWPRNKVAALLETIYQAGPKVVGLDIVFAEPDRTSPVRALAEVESVLKAYVPPETLFKQLEAYDHDRILGDLIEKYNPSVPTVAGYFFIFGGEEATLEGDMPSVGAGWNPHLLPRQAGLTWAETLLYTPSRPVHSIEDVFLTAGSEGFFTFTPGEEGEARFVPLLMQYNGVPYPSLALEVARVGLGIKQLEVTVVPQAAGRAHILSLRLDDKRITTDARGRIPVNFRGPTRENIFPYISASDVFHRRTPSEALKDKYVLIGTSAEGLLDLRSTPFSRACPGVEVHANVVDNILLNDSMVYDDAAEYAVNALIILGVGLGLTLSLSFLSVHMGGLFMLLSMTGILLGNYYLAFCRQQLFGITFSILSVMLIFAATTLTGYFVEGRDKRFIQNAFQHYVSPDLVQNILTTSGGLGLGGEKKELTVLFSDIRSFTTISETMDPRELTQFLNEYLTEMTELVMNQYGMVDKFIGDAVMAVWGAPLETSKHPLYATQAALKMMDRLREMQPQWQARGLPCLDIGIGINTGPMSVGNMGSRRRFDYTVIGDNVNFGARLEGLNKQYGTHVLISEHTWRQVSQDICCRLLDKVRVKGKKDAVCIYEALYDGTPSPEMRRTVDRFEEGLFCYWERDFEAAKAIFSALQAEAPSTLHEVYLDRIAHWLQAPPPADWDGCWTFTTK